MHVCGGIGEQEGERLRRGAREGERERASLIRTSSKYHPKAHHCNWVRVSAYELWRRGGGVLVCKSGCITSSNMGDLLPLALSTSCKTGDQASVAEPWAHIEARGTGQRLRKRARTHVVS